MNHPYTQKIVRETEQRWPGTANVRKNVHKGEEGSLKVYENEEERRWLKKYQPHHLLKKSYEIGLDAEIPKINS